MGMKYAEALPDLRLEQACFTLWLGVEIRTEVCQ